MSEFVQLLLDVWVRKFPATQCTKDYGPGKHFHAHAGIHTQAAFLKCLALIFKKSIYVCKIEFTNEASYSFNVCALIFLKIYLYV